MPLLAYLANRNSSINFQWIHGCAWINMPIAFCQKKHFFWMLAIYRYIIADHFQSKCQNTHTYTHSFSLSSSHQTMLLWSFVLFQHPTHTKHTNTHILNCPSPLLFLFRSVLMWVHSRTLLFILMLVLLSKEIKL